MPRTLTLTLLKQDDNISVKDINQILRVGDKAYYLVLPDWGNKITKPIANLLKGYLKNKIELPETIEFTYK